MTDRPSPATGVPPSHDLVVLGAGPAGRALAHRAAAAGLDTAVVDPDPHRTWSQTFGAFEDDLPDWLPAQMAATHSGSVVAYTPRRQVIERRYIVLDNIALRRYLHLDAVTIITARAGTATPRSVRLDGGQTLHARAVIDATGRRAGVPDAPHQRAYGVIGTAGADVESVLMDWRPPPGATPGTPTFSYRVPLGGGRFLVEETFLAGRPPSMDDLAHRWAQRGTPSGWRGSDGNPEVEFVDFPLVDSGPAPWVDDGAPVRFGAAGGMMHPATGYSVAESLRCVDTVVAAVRAGREPRTALWPARARTVYRLRRRGLGVLLGLRDDETAEFFDAFFRIDPAAQRAYLGARDDVPGVLRAMVLTFAELDWRGRGGLLRAGAADALEQIRSARR